MGYMAAGAALIIAVLSGIIWLQNENIATLNQQVGAAVTIQSQWLETFDTMNKQFATAQEKMSDLQESRVQDSIDRQTAIHEVDRLQASLERKSLEAPFEAGVDIHNWFADWMLAVQDATSPRGSAPVHHDNGGTDSGDIPPE